jgi:cytochrome subunit of sulfide dehydrogenase
MHTQRQHVSFVKTRTTHCGCVRVIANFLLSHCPGLHAFLRRRYSRPRIPTGASTMHSSRFAAVLAAAAALAFPAHAQDAQGLQAAGLAATCANCHGTQGKVVGSALPPLAGMNKDAMLEQLRAFRSGARPATIMHQLTKGYTDAQLEQIATYFSRQSR